MSDVWSVLAVLLVFLTLWSTLILRYFDAKFKAIDQRFDSLERRIERLENHLMGERHIE